MLAQLMIVRLMSHPAGLVKKAWRKTLRRTVPAESEPIGIVAPPPIWPYRYRGTGISLFTLEERPAADAPVPSEPPRPVTASRGVLPFASGHFSYDDHAASFLGPHAC